MMIKYTEFKLGELSLGYELYDDGYGIYFGDGLTIVQNENNLPYPNLPFELNAILQIKDLCGIPYDLEEEIKTNSPISDSEQLQLTMALQIEYLTCLHEVNNI